MAVDPACSCLQTDGCLECKVHVLRPDACPEAKACVVGKCNSFFGCAEGEDGQNRAKDLEGGGMNGGMRSGGGILSN